MPESRYFSIIIPVYNAERTLFRCLSSVCAQRFEDFEVILVDDGSADQSSSIYEKFITADLRFKVIRQENHGPSSARNRGLIEAKGLYICFVDSDDYVSEDYLSRLYERTVTHEPDAVFFGFYKVNPQGFVIEKKLPPSGVAGIKQLFELSKKDMFGYTWIKCFRRKAAENLTFPEDMSLFEDEVFCCQVLRKTDRIDVLPEALYYYTDAGADMLTRRLHEDYCSLSDRVFLAWEGLLEGNPEGEKFLAQKADALTYRCIYYGLEQDVNVSFFFDSLRQTNFYKKHTKWNRLDRFIQHGSWFMLEMSRIHYRIKSETVLLFNRLKKSIRQGIL